MPSPQRQQAEPQHMIAFARANEVRLGIADKKREIEALPEVEGRRLAADTIEKPDDIICSARVGAIMRSIHRFGDGKVGKVLRLAGVAAVDKRIGDLTIRQRHIIAGALRDPRKVHTWSQLPRVEDGERA